MGGELNIMYEKAKYYSNALYGLADIEKSIDSLLRYTSYLSDDEQQQLIDCCFFAADAHKGQKRQTGEPYVCHPIKVAEILAHYVQFNLPVLQGAVLHDVIEDTPVCKKEIAEAFTDEVANLVDGVSKLEKDKNVSPQELQARTFTKLVVAMSADPRVVMIKFADRLHNMQTLGALRADKRKRIAKETLDVYVPIATRLGMFVFKNKLEEMALQHIYPWRYSVVEKIAEDTNPQREEVFQQVKSLLTDSFKEYGITNIAIRKRRRNLYDIYKKIERQRFNRRPLERASIPLVIITNSTDECYRILGIIHQLYTPVIKKLADYIASPKANGYQSIHTSVLTQDKQVLNFQIRSKDMHAVAESGIIAIWREHNQLQIDELRKEKARRRYKSMRRWLGNIENLNTMVSSPVEFYETVKRDLINFEIQVLTPKGDPIALPTGATVIDFAYAIHTELGNHLKSAQVNGVEVSFDYALSNGQTVELFADTAAHPKTTWLKWVKTARAKAAIRQYLRGLSPEILEDFGYLEMQNFLADQDINYQTLRSMLEVVANRKNMSLSELLQRIARHDESRREIAMMLKNIAEQQGITSRVTVVFLNSHGALNAITEVIGKWKANIINLELPPSIQTQKVTIGFVLQVEQLEQLQKIIYELLSLSLVRSVEHEENI